MTNREAIKNVCNIIQAHFEQLKSEKFEYCMTHCTRSPAVEFLKQSDPQVWMCKTFENVEKNKELQMQNFCYCDYKENKPDQLVVPLTCHDDEQFYHGDIRFDRDFKTNYRVDDVVITEDSNLVNILVVNDDVAKLRHIPNDYDKQNLRNLVMFTVETFTNPIQINVTTSIIGQKIVVTGHLRSSHDLKLVEVRLSKIKENK